MRRHSKLNTRKCLLSAAIGCAAFAVPISSVYAQIEEIIVIARKTEENLQDVPVAVTALTGSALDDAGVTEFSQVASLTPNFDVRSNAVRGEFAADLTIRGQTSTTSDLSIDQAVGININGAPVTRGTNLFGNLFDIEQIEILKGPQGTLFGKNTTGGLVIVTTTAPQLGENSGYFETTVGNFGQTDAEIVGNIALGDIAALRLGAAITKRDGYVDGLRSDGTDSGIDFGNDDEEFFRASLLIEPSEQLSIRINADTHEVDEYGAGTRALITRPLFGTFQALAIDSDEFYVAGNFNDGAFAPAPDNSSVTAEETNFNVTVEADIGFADLTSITSYRDQESNTDLNFTPIGGIIIGQDSELLAQELRLSGATDAVAWQAGLFVSSEDGNDRNNTVGRGQVTAVENESTSIFGQASFDLAESLSLTAGIRYSQEDRKVEITQLAAAGGSISDAAATLGTTSTESGLVFLNDGDMGAPGTAIANEADFNGVSWSIALDYKATNDQLVYGSVSKGFRSGGIDGDNDITVEVDPEFVLNYELGYKAEFLDNTLRWNSAVWISDYTDIQITSFSLTDGVAGTVGVPLNILNNAAEAELYGVETEILWSPNDDFTLSTGLGYTEGEFSDFTEPREDGMGGLIEFDRSDEPVGGPELQFNISARYGFDVGENTRGAFQLTYTYLDEQILASPAVIDLVNTAAADFAALDEFVGPEDDFGVVDAFGLLNGQLEFEVGDSLNIAFWGKNLTDKEYYSTGFALAISGGLSQRNIGTPRQYGATFRYDF